MKIKQLVMLGTVFVLSACATTYRFDGKSYSGEEQFQSAVDMGYAQTRQQLVAELRVPAPIAKKTLTVGVPTTDANKSSIRIVSPLQQPQQDNLGLAMRKEELMFAEAIRDIGIYQVVKIVDTTGGHLQPSSTESVLYFYVLVGGGGQWYINGGKAGMQTVNTDRGQPDLLGKARSIIVSVKGYALTD